MVKWEFRGYERTDLSAMAELDDICFDPPFRFSRGLMRTLAEGPDAVVVIAVADGALMGFAIADIETDGENQVGYVMTIDVDPRARRNGVARELLWRMEKQVRERGGSEMLLHVWTENEAATMLYASSGYQQMFREKDFYDAGLDAFLFAKRLK